MWTSGACLVLHVITSFVFNFEMLGLVLGFFLFGGTISPALCLDIFIFIYFFYLYIYMCIQCLGHISPFSSAPPQYFYKLVVKYIFIRWSEKYKPIYVSVFLRIPYKDDLN
jgi:hypothetical protein